MGIRGRRCDATLVDVAERNLSGPLDACVRLRISHPAAFAVADRHSQDRAAKSVGERRSVTLDADAHPVRAIGKVSVADERAGQESGLAEDLEAIAAPEDRAALRCETAELLRPGRELRDRAGAKVVAIAEAARHDRGVEPAQVRVLVPLDLRLDTRYERERVREVALAPRAGVAENRDARHPTSLMHAHEAVGRNFGS